MKKVIAIMIAFMLFSVSAVAEDIISNLNLSEMDDETLGALQLAIEAEIQSRKGQEEHTEVTDNNVIIDENVFVNAGYTISEDIFSGQKLFYLENPDTILKGYNTNTNDIMINTKIFGDDIIEVGEAPALKNECGFYPSVIYNKNNPVPYTFIAALTIGKNEISIGLWAPISVKIATSNQFYELMRYIPSMDSSSKNVLFIPINQTSIEMFKALEKEDSFILRVENWKGETADFTLSSESVESIIPAWELFEQAGGTNQDLTLYSDAITFQDR